MSIKELAVARDRRLLRGEVQAQPVAIASYPYKRNYLGGARDLSVIGMAGAGTAAAGALGLAGWQVAKLAKQGQGAVDGAVNDVKEKIVGGIKRRVDKMDAVGRRVGRFFVPGAGAESASPVMRALYKVRKASGRVASRVTRGKVSFERGDLGENFFMKTQALKELAYGVSAERSSTAASKARINRMAPKLLKNAKLQKNAIIAGSSLVGAGLLGGVIGYQHNRRRIAAQKKADALNSILESAARQQHQQRSKAMGVGNVGLRELKELSELSALAADGTLKELGFFTRQVPRYGEQGQFEGMKTQIKPVNTAATVGAGAGVGAAGYAAHRGIMDKFGTVAGTYGGDKQVLARRTIPESYKAAWESGPRSMANAGVGGIAGGIENVGARVGAGGFAGRIGKALRGLKFLKV